MPGPFVVAGVGQGVLGLRLKERLDRDHVVWKTGGVLLLVLGGLLVG